VLLMEQLRRLASSVVAWWKALPLRDQRLLFGGAGFFAVVLVLVVALAGGSGVAGVSLRPASAGPEETSVAGPDGSGDGQLGSESPTPEAAIGSVSELVSLYGDPPGYDFARLRIPVLGVDAPVGISIVSGESGAQLGSPEGPAAVFWYDLSAWPGLGGLPGAGGNAVFGAHVDISGYVPYADANYHGPAIFRELYLLAPGDRVMVDRNGETLEYQVVWSEQVGANDATRWTEIWSSNVATDSITLYTCGGDFDWDTREYPDRLVVRAERV
jgi:LPXTG-site transpeptidase (sortase) family protein